MPGLPSFLLAFISHREKIPAGAVLAAAQCLYAITLDNPPFNSNLPSNVVQDLLAVVQSEQIKMLEETPVPTAASKGKTEGMEVETEKTRAVEVVSEDKKSLLRVLIAGVLHNLNDDGAEIIEGLDNRVVGPLLRPVLDLDLAQVAQEVIKTVPEIPTISEKDAKEIKNMKSDLRSPAEIKLDSIEKRLSTLMVALEVMTSVCAGLVDAEDPAVGGDDEDEDADVDEEMDMDGEADLDEALIAKGREQVGDDSMAVEQPKRTGSTSLDGLMGSNMHTRLFALAQATELSYPPASGGLSLHPPSTAFLSSIHLRALEALNNLLLTISSYAPTPAPPLPSSVQDVPSSDRKARSEWKQFVAQSFTNLNQLWEGSFEIAKQIVGADGSTPSGTELLEMKGQEVRKDALEVLAGVWVGLARIGSYGGLVSLARFGPFTPVGRLHKMESGQNIAHEQITGLTQVYTLLPSTNLKTRIISALATLSMTEGLALEQNKVIGDLLMSLIGASQPVSTEETVAALNAIFDVYSDERCTYNEVFTTGGYLAKLTAVVSKCKSLVCHSARSAPPGSFG